MEDIRVVEEHIERRVRDCAQEEDECAGEDAADVAASLPCEHCPQSADYASNNGHERDRVSVCHVHVEGECALKAVEV
eukprot:scaffold269909_cov37-Tisochrysis_lutea.AAC.2